MAATENVRQLPPSHNSGAELTVPRHGVVTLFGYGIQVRVDRGHLLLEDGIGPDRRYVRLPRIGHGLKRLVVIGSDGMVSLAALRWLADQDASFVMLERNGKVLTVTGPLFLCKASTCSGPRAFIRRCFAHHAGTDQPKARRTGTSCAGSSAGFNNCEHDCEIQGGKFPRATTSRRSG